MIKLSPLYILCLKDFFWNTDIDGAQNCGNGDMDVAGADEVVVWDPLCSWRQGVLGQCTLVTSDMRILPAVIWLSCTLSPGRVCELPLQIWSRSHSKFALAPLGRIHLSGFHWGGGWCLYLYVDDGINQGGAAECKGVGVWSCAWPGDRSDYQNTSAALHIYNPTIVAFFKMSRQDTSTMRFPQLVRLVRGGEWHVSMHKNGNCLVAFSSRINRADRNWLAFNQIDNNLDCPSKTRWQAPP